MTRRSAQTAMSCVTRTSQAITSTLRTSLQGRNMSAEAWCGVRQLLLLRTKRKAAEAALSTFMLAGDDKEVAQNRLAPTPVSTLVLNCFIDVIGQQVFSHVSFFCSAKALKSYVSLECRNFTPA